MARRSIDGCRGILTGASSGIGRALATQLVRQGARLLVVARRPQRLAELAASLADAPGRIEVLAGDVTDPEVRKTAVERASQSFGGLDLLINNAGSGAMGRFDEASAERLQHVMDVNFFAPAEMIRVALPLLRSGNRPMVVNVSSILGHRGVPFCAEYCASKFALQGLSESLRAEFASRGVNLLVVSPAHADRILRAGDQRGGIALAGHSWHVRRMGRPANRGRHPRGPARDRDQSQRKAAVVGKSAVPLGRGPRAGPQLKAPTGGPRAAHIRFGPWLTSPWRLGILGDASPPPAHVNAQPPPNCQGALHDFPHATTISRRLDVRGRRGRCGRRDWFGLRRR